MGRAFDTTGSYQTVLLRLALLTLAAALLMLLLPRYRRVPADQGPHVRARAVFRILTEGPRTPFQKRVPLVE